MQITVKNFIKLKIMLRKAIIIIVVILLAVKVDARPQCKDGTYSGISRSNNKPYYGVTKITVKQGVIVSVSFVVRDSVRHENLSEKLERNFVTNSEHVVQSRNERKGICRFSREIVRPEDISKLEYRSGTTWSDTLFKISFEQAFRSMYPSEFNQKQAPNHEKAVFQTPR